MARRQPGLSIALSGDWQKFHSWALAFQGNLGVASKIATKLAVQFALSEIIMKIKQGRYKKLAPLTKLLRQMEGYSDTPLMRTGGLVRSISTDVVSSFEGNVGLLRQGKGRSKTDFSNIGLLLHDGGRIRITDAMRRSFARRINALAKKNGVSLLQRRGSKKNMIRIPPRRFIEDVFNDPEFVVKVQEIYARTLKSQLGF